MTRFPAILTIKNQINRVHFIRPAQIDTRECPAIRRDRRGDPYFLHLSTSHHLVKKHSTWRCVRDVIGYQLGPTTLVDDARYVDACDVGGEKDGVRAIACGRLREGWCSRECKLDSSSF